MTSPVQGRPSGPTRAGQGGEAPLPEGLKHSLRHTYVSLRLALGHDLVAVSQDAGHSGIEVTLRIYAHLMKLGRPRARAPAGGGRGRLLGRGGRNPAESEARTAQKRRAQQDSNLRPLAPEASALSTELCALAADSRGRLRAPVLESR